MPAWTCIRHPPPSLPLPTDVSKLTDTICGVGNMSVNASDQERTPWHVTFKVWGRRGGGLDPRGENSQTQPTCTVVCSL